MLEKMSNNQHVMLSETYDYSLVPCLLELGDGIEPPHQEPQLGLEGVDGN
jgi:hypothetical protein